MKNWIVFETKLSKSSTTAPKNKPNASLNNQSPAVEFASKTFQTSKMPVTNQFDPPNANKSIKNQYSGDLVKVPKHDPQAEKLLSQRIINGQTSMKFSNDKFGKEFDIINEKFIIETKPALRSIKSSFRKQAKRAFEAAQQTGRKVYFHFEGEPAAEIINKLNKYQTRYGIEMIIDTKPCRFLIN